MVWRRFLQDASTSVDSYVVVDVPKVEDGTDQSMMLKIADCERNVRLWFGWSTAKARRQSRKKLTRLRQAIDLLEAGLDELEESLN